MKREELQVDVARFLERTKQVEQQWEARMALWGAAGKPAPQGVENWWAPMPMQKVPYDVLVPRLDGCLRLAAVEALDGVDGVKVGGAVLLAMASRIFLPQVPAEHAARKPTEALLAALAGYLFDGEPAEHYLSEAFRYRSRFGTSMTAIGRDPSYENLFEAMPADGLDCALGLGCWGLAGHWRSFGRHLAKQGADWQALDKLLEDARAAVLVSWDEAGNDAACEALAEMVDDQQDGYIDRALDAHDEALRALVDDLLDTLCSVPEQAIPRSVPEATRERRAAHRADRQGGADACRGSRALDILLRAHLALSASHNLTVTDRPDLPRALWPVWVTDHSVELASLDEAIAILSSGTDPGCADRSTSPSTTPSGSQ